MFRKTLVALGVAAALLLTPTAVMAKPVAAPAPAPTPTTLRTYPPVATPRLVDVRFARHRTFDRLVFDFRGGTPDVETRYVRRVFADPSGRRVFLPGRAFLLVRFESARARDFERRTVYTPDLRNVRALRLVGDFEGVVTVALALRNRVGVRVQDFGNRVVVDVPNFRFYRTLE